MGSRSAGWAPVGFAWLLFGVAIGFSACDDGEEEETTTTTSTTELAATTTAAAKIVLEKDDSAAWMTMNNTYDNTFKNDKVGWSGVLFQLGSFNKADFQHAGVELYKGGAVASDLRAATDFYWINIVADEGKQDPIDPANAFYLFPSTAISTSCPLTVDPCDRNRRLQGNESVITGLITYWHGSHGYQVTATPSPQEGYWPDRFEFALLDDVKVEVRRMDTSAATPTWIVESTFAKGDIDSIIVRDGSKPPDLGAKQEPGWPFP